MEFSVYYCSTRAVTAAEAEAIDQAADRLCDDPEWVGCEPIYFSECLDADLTETPVSGRSPIWLQQDKL